MGVYELSVKMRYLIFHPIVFFILLLIFSGNASKVSEICVLEMDGESYQSIQLTNTYYYPNIRLNGPGLCNLRILAVGGGGDGVETNRGRSGNGGGSGYIQYRSINGLFPTNITAKVGERKRPSIVTITGRDTITALNGENGDHWGNGYCGGGWGVSAHCNGGSNGGNAEYGGHGTGEDITAYALESWIVTPGAGGNKYHDLFGYYGGGGGGVLVDGLAPDRTRFQGEKYGGGGLGRSFYHNEGLSGVILLETTSG